MLLDQTMTDADQIEMDIQTCQSKEEEGKTRMDWPMMNASFKKSHLL